MKIIALIICCINQKKEHDWLWVGFAGDSSLVLANLVAVDFTGLKGGNSRWEQFLSNTLH